MIRINIVRDSKQEVRIIEVTGHAGFADSGYDIVCAAVSSQLISVENSLQQLLHIPVEVEVDEIVGGYLKLVIPVVEDTAINTKGQFLLEHLVLALKVIAQEYAEFVKIQ